MDKKNFSNKSGSSPNKPQTPKAPVSPKSNQIQKKKKLEAEKEELEEKTNDASYEICEPEREDFLEPVFSEEAQQDDISIEPVFSEEAQQDDISIEPVFSEEAQQDDISIEPVFSEEAQQDDISIEPVFSEEAEQDDTSIEPVFLEEAEQDDTSIEPVFSEEAQQEDEPVFLEETEQGDIFIEPISSEEIAGLDENLLDIEMQEELDAQIEFYLKNSSQEGIMSFPEPIAITDNTEFDIVSDAPTPSNMDMGEYFTHGLLGQKFAFANAKLDEFSKILTNFGKAENELTERIKTQETILESKIEEYQGNFSEFATHGEMIEAKAILEETIGISDFVNEIVGEEFQKIEAEIIRYENELKESVSELKQKETEIINENYHVEFKTGEKSSVLNDLLEKFKSELDVLDTFNDATGGLITALDKFNKGSDAASIINSINQLIELNDSALDDLKSVSDMVKPTISLAPTLLGLEGASGAGGLGLLADGVYHKFVTHELLEQCIVEINNLTGVINELDKKMIESLGQVSPYDTDNGADVFGLLKTIHNTPAAEIQNIQISDEVRDHFLQNESRYNLSLENKMPVERTDFLGINLNESIDKKNLLDWIDSNFDTIWAKRYGNTSLQNL
jgi:hypothetical protein